MTVSQPHEDEIFRDPTPALTCAILSAPDLPSGCRNGHDLTIGYRDVARAALDQLAAMRAEETRLRDRLDRAHDEIRRLRQLCQRAA